MPVWVAARKNRRQRKPSSRGSFEAGGAQFDCSAHGPAPTCVRRFCSIGRLSVEYGRIDLGSIERGGIECGTIEYGSGDRRRPEHLSGVRDCWPQDSRTRGRSDLKGGRLKPPATRAGFLPGFDLPVCFA